MIPGPASCTRWGAEIREHLEARAWDRSARTRDEGEPGAGPGEARVAGLLDALLANPGEAASPAADHLAACAECRERAERFVRLIDLLANLPRATAPAELTVAAVAPPVAGPRRTAGLESLLRSLPRHTAPAALDAHVEFLLAGGAVPAGPLAADAEVPAVLAEARIVPLRRRRAWAAVAAAAALLVVFAILGSLPRVERAPTTWVGQRTGLRLEFQSAATVEPEDAAGRGFLELLAGWAAPPASAAPRGDGGRTR